MHDCPQTLNFIFERLAMPRLVGCMHIMQVQDLKAFDMSYQS
jgi:hypothetical protein